MAGIIVALYVVGVRLADPDMPEKSVYRICTTAILCSFYYAVGGLTGVFIQASLFKMDQSSKLTLFLQLAGSVCGLSVNLLLLVGAMYRITVILLMWLISYILAIIGCFVLFGIMLDALLVRDKLLNDVETGTYFLTVIPLLIGIIYIFCWIFIFLLWRQLKRRENQVFVCVE